jgi:hypothetical protein
MNLPDTPRDWQAMWITESWQRDAYPLLGGPLAFRRDYTLPARPTSAPIVLTASARYYLWINGTFIESGPARSYPGQQLYDEIDIARWLVAGRNTIAIVVQKPSGITGYSLINRMGLFVEGKIVCADRVIPIRTDATWQVRNAEWYLETPYLYTIPLGFQEHLAGAQEPPAWKIAEPGAGWGNAFCLGDADTPPWKNLVASITRKNLEIPFTPRLCWKGTTDRALPDVRLNNLARVFEAQSVTGSNVDFETTGDWFQADAENVFVFDFGKTRYVRPSVAVRDLTGQVRLEFFYHLALTDRPHAVTGFGHEKEGACDSFTPDANTLHWMGLTPRGFRFLTIKVAGTGQCQFKLQTNAIEYPYQQNNHFQCDDEFLQSVWDTSLETLRSATTDVIGEPARENVLWTFDGCVGGKAAYYSFGDTAMWRHCLQLSGQGIDDDGIPNAVVPAGYSFMTLIDQALYWVWSCREYYLVSGDQAFLQQQLPAIERLLRLCQQHLTDQDLFIPPGYAWHWVDWAPLNKEPYSMPINALLLLAAQAAHYLAQEVPLGSESLIALSTDLCQRLSQSLLAFYDEQENGFRSHLPAGGDHPISSINHSVPVEFDLHSNALACLAQLGTVQQRQGAVAKMLQILAGAKDHIATMDEQVFGIGWTQLILEPLFRQGQTQAGLRYLRRYFQPFIDRKASTWAEDFVLNIYNTAHGWGASVNSLMVEGLCGIEPLAPGWRKLRVQPRLPPGLNMEYRFQTVLGEIGFKSEANRYFLCAPVGVEVETDRNTYVSQGDWMEV